ncbi:AAA family ATPase [Mucilaginibacter terrigena]|nr:AAA family ATPase [Mucilaginibacter terrigena]
MTDHPTAERPAIIEQLRAEIKGIPYRPAKKRKPQPVPPDPEESRYLFHVATGNRWMELGEREPVPKMLFGELWHQGELCILFADTNVGKSILAVQIGNSIAEGKRIAHFAMHAKPATVLYIDFELGVTQFYTRYTHARSSYNFTDKFIRAQFTPNTGLPGGDSNNDDHLIAAIEYRIQQLKATVLIIDNISCLRGGTENAQVALSLMKNLKALKNEYKLSVLVLAHTPKRRNLGLPLSADNLHGSKLLINFADSAFALGTSATDPQLRYLKQIKQRNTAQIYGEDNVCLCRITKPENFLKMQFEGQSHEYLHLRTRQTNQLVLAPKIAQLAAAGYTQRQISTELGIAVGLVNRLIKK